MWDLLWFIAVIVFIFIPALAVTARFALRPMVDAIIRLREGMVGNPSASLEVRLGQLEAELADVRNTMERLVETQQFDRELDPGRPERTLAQEPAKGSEGGAAS